MTCIDLFRTWALVLILIKNIKLFKHKSPKQLNNNNGNLSLINCHKWNITLKLLLVHFSRCDKHHAEPGSHIFLNKGSIEDLVIVGFEPRDELCWVGAVRAERGVRASTVLQETPPVRIALLRERVDYVLVESSRGIVRLAIEEEGESFVHILHQFRVTLARCLRLLFARSKCKVGTLRTHDHKLNYWKEFYTNYNI